MPTPEQIRNHASDPLAFIGDLTIPGARGVARFGSALADFQREEFAALAPALVAVANGAKPSIGRFWWERTKGASKDSDLAAALLWLLAFSRRPLLIQVGAADQDQAAELRKAAVDILRLNPWLAERIDVQAWKLLCEANGSACEIIAADVAGSHGARPDVLVVNELSHVTRQEFAENLLDNAAKVPHGLVCIATNAGFLGTWQEQWRKLAQESDRWRFHVWDRPAPWLDPAEIEEAKRRNSLSRYLRLWYGAWASGAGDAIDADDLQAAVDPSAGPMFGDEPDFGFGIGLDLGVRRDHSAAVVLGFNWRTHRVHLAACESWAPPPGGQVDLSAVQKRVLQLAQRFHVGGMFYDPWQAELMAQQLAQQRLPVFPVPFTSSNLTKMATALLTTFRERTITLYDDRQLIEGLGRLSIVERSFGCKLEAPRDKGGHADKAFALAIALPEIATAAATFGPIDAGPDLAGLQLQNLFNRPEYRH